METKLKKKFIDTENKLLWSFKNEDKSALLAEYILAHQRLCENVISEDLFNKGTLSTKDYYREINSSTLFTILKYTNDIESILPKWLETTKSMRAEIGFWPFSIDQLIALEKHKRTPIINKWLLSSIGEFATPFGEENKLEIIDFLEFPSSIEPDNSFFSEFFLNYNVSKKTNTTLQYLEYKKYFVVTAKSRIHSKRYDRLNDYWLKFEEELNPKYAYQKKFRAGEKHLYHPNGGRKWYIKGNGQASISLVKTAITESMNERLFLAENNWRKAKGLNKIGEGWKSETELYYRLKKKLNKKEVIMHGRPKWLGRQHLDVWIPELKVAIEYQGLQHDEPVDFFGGEKNYTETIKRDKRKKLLCKNNGVRLIEVRMGYDIEKLILEITGQ